MKRANWMRILEGRKVTLPPKKRVTKFLPLTHKEWVEIEIQKNSSVCGGCLSLSETVAQE